MIRPRRQQVLSGSTPQKKRCPVACSKQSSRGLCSRGRGRGDRGRLPANTCARQDVALPPRHRHCPPRREAERSWRGRSNGMLGPGLGSASPTTSTRPQARFRHTQTPAAAADLEALHSSCRHSNQYQRVAAGGGTVPCKIRGWRCTLASPHLSILVRRGNKRHVGDPPAQKPEARSKPISTLATRRSFPPHTYHRCSCILQRRQPHQCPARLCPCSPYAAVRHSPLATGWRGWQSEQQYSTACGLAIREPPSALLWSLVASEDPVDPVAPVAPVAGVDHASRSVARAPRSLWWDRHEG